MSWEEEAKQMWGLLDPMAPEDETTQQKAVRLSTEARTQAQPGPVVPQPRDVEEEPQALQDTQAKALPNPASEARLKQKLRVMLAKRGS